MVIERFETAQTSLPPLSAESRVPVVVVVSRRSIMSASRFR